MVSPEVIAERGYSSVSDSKALEDEGFPAGTAPALLIPWKNVHGERAAYQIRLDIPILWYQKKRRYLFPKGHRNFVDVPPRCLRHIGNPGQPLWIVEGPIKADTLASLGACAIGLAGVAGWRHTNEQGGKTAVPCFQSIALNDRVVYLAFDSDIKHNTSVKKQAVGLKSYLESRGAKAFILEIPDGPNGEKQGPDDFIANGGTLEQLQSFIAITGRRPAQPATPKPEPEPVEPKSLSEVENAYRSYLEMPNLDVLHVTLAAMVANYIAHAMASDPLWLALVAAPSSSKTEHISAVGKCPAVHSVAELSVAALLSGTGRKDRTAESHGGLLTSIGGFGILLLKDFTTILSMKYERRSELLAALREIYDGEWTRHVGSDGGQTLHWKGRVGLVAACTEAIDDYHAVMSAMGQRLIFFRMEDAPPEIKTKQVSRALSNMIYKDKLREELATTTAGLFTTLLPQLKQWPELSADTKDTLTKLACLAATARSAVTRDSYQKEIINVPDPEVPTRLAQQLFQMYASLLALGLPAARAGYLLRKIGFDSLPKMRRKVLLLVAEANQPLATAQVATTLRAPTTTIERALEELNALGILERYKPRENLNEWEILPYWRQAYGDLHRAWPTPHA